MSFQKGLPLAWNLRIVPGVDHDFRKMANAAAELWFGAGP